MTTDQARRDARRRVDESMDILNDVIRNPIDPDYAVAAGRGSSRPRSGWVIATVILGFGLMVGTSVASTVRAAPQVQVERAELIARVKATAERVDDLRTTSAAIIEENRALLKDALGDEGAQDAQERLDALDAATGGRAVIGSGVVIVADDGESEDRNARVVDVDLRQAVNSLWQAGAEAIAINGHRLSARTSIRGAGDAITVDYRSLSGPYRIEAIGDGDRMTAAFPESAGGQWWAYLRQNYGIRFELSQAGTLELPADPGLGLEYAKVAQP